MFISVTGIYTLVKYVITVLKTIDSPRQKIIWGNALSHLKLAKQTSYNCCKTDNTFFIIQQNLRFHIVT